MISYFRTPTWGSSVIGRKERWHSLTAVLQGSSFQQCCGSLLGRKSSVTGDNEEAVTCFSPTFQSHSSTRQSFAEVGSCTLLYEQKVSFHRDTRTSYFHLYVSCTETGFPEAKMTLANGRLQEKQQNLNSEPSRLSHQQSVRNSPAVVEHLVFCYKDTEVWYQKFSGKV